MIQPVSWFLITVAHSTSARSFVAVRCVNHLREEAEVVSNGLNNLHSPYGTSLWTMATEYKRTFESARKVLSREIGNIPQDELNGINWERVLPNIHIH